MIDLRSDTVTKPTPAMLQAMMSAEVGDDVFGEDPTVNLLQETVAEMFGKQAGLFVTSGTMGNELCVKAHTQPGDEIILEQEAHVYVYENGATAGLCGVQCRTLPGKNGLFTAAQVTEAIRPGAYYLPQTKLICIENTHGRSAGSVIPLDGIIAIESVANAAGIPFHMDGARVWNASVASGVSLNEYGKHFASLSVCFSKGLGAPIGSMVLGTRDFIEKVRVYRKMWGGGMRQAGYLAAAALYAVKNNITRLAEDHEKARKFADMVGSLKGFSIDQSQLQTNMVFIDIAGTGKTQNEVLETLYANGINMTPERRTSIRAVMHLGVSMAEVTKAGETIQRIFR